MNKFTMTINGCAVESAKLFDVINPATEEVFASCPEAEPEHVDEAVTSAHTAYKTWSTLTESQRGDYLVQAADALEQAIDEIAPVISKEQGKALAKAKMELNFSVFGLRSYSNFQLPIEVLFDDDERHIEIQRVPIGVVGLRLY